MKKMGGFVYENGDFRRGRDEQDNEESRDAREKRKVFENCPENIVQNMLFLRLE